ncbi:hypothetical protein L1987_44493 [Smallanthus sonchifolius]|uniref:Uncharacterized protein n=1 Tax=Smallanthus sonchifolius TaxID=185202 RepID=A0ACB9GQV9_9ASTR|nr:hypothetical protein L1987_44493 [Smallanthus sonchifolius]
MLTRDHHSYAALELIVLRKHKRKYLNAYEGGSCEPPRLLLSPPLDALSTGLFNYCTPAEAFKSGKDHRKQRELEAASYVHGTERYEGTDGKENQLFIFRVDEKEAVMVGVG